MLLRCDYNKHSDVFAFTEHAWPHYCPITQNIGMCYVQRTIDSFVMMATSYTITSIRKLGGSLLYAICYLIFSTKQCFIQGVGKM